MAKAILQEQEAQNRPVSWECLGSSGENLFSTALAVLFTLVDSGIDVLVVVLLSGDSFDCSKLLNRVEPITQTRQEEKRKRDKGEKGEKEKKGKRKKGRKKRKRRKWGKWRKWRKLGK